MELNDQTFIIILLTKAPNGFNMKVGLGIFSFLVVDASVSCQLISICRSRSFLSVPVDESVLHEILLQWTLAVNFYKRRPLNFANSSNQPTSSLSSWDFSMTCKATFQFCQTDVQSKQLSTASTTYIQHTYM